MLETVWVPHYPPVGNTATSHCLGSIDTKQLQFAELVLALPVTKGCLINHGDIVRGCFIMLDIAPIHKVQLPPVDKLAHQIFSIICLLLPPSSEEGLP